MNSAPTTRTNRAPASASPTDDARRRAGLLSDTALVMVRELRPVLRDPFSLLFGLTQPLVFLALFGPLVAGTLTGGGATADTWAWFVPGILVMTALYGTAATGSGLQEDLVMGSHERLLVTPLARPALFLGRSLKEFAPLILQAVVLIVAMVPFGFRPHPLGAVLGLVLLGVMGIGIGSLSYALALIVKDNHWIFWTVHQTAIFPLMILSGMLLPLDAGPAWMRVAGAINPLTHVVDAERALFAGDLLTSEVAAGSLAALATALVGAALGLRALRHTTR